MITPLIEILSTPWKAVEIMAASPDLPQDRTFEKVLLTISFGTIIPGNPRLKLKSDVFASIDWTKDGVVISSALFDEDGYGRTYEDAWEDFVVSLRDKYASLEKREQSLSPADRAVLEELRSSITTSNS